MSYIDKVLMPDETILYRTRPHWIIFASTVAWLLVAFFISLIGPEFPLSQQLPLTKIFGYLFLALAAYTGLDAYITYITSEYAITNKRILMKTGFIRRVTFEIFLRSVESVIVNQSILGRILGYGTTIIGGVGGSKDPFYNIPNPLDFRAKVQQLIDQLPDAASAKN